MAELAVGDYADLIVPVKGYKHVEIVNIGFPYILVRTESGWEFEVYEDELEF